MSTTHSRAGHVPAAGQSFAALRRPGFRMFFFGTMTAMMADNIEHVISYWVIAREFNSPALGGFAVVAHWLPFLLFSVHAGALADRFDVRRLIQLGMLLFMGVSITWGLLFLTDTLQMWHAMVLLVIHGIAGVLWTPPSQLLLHDIVGTELLQSAIRLTATARYLGMLLGPAVGGGMLLLLGESQGILLNALIYLPMLLWLWKTQYGARSRKRVVAPTLRGLGDIISTLREIAGQRVISSMILLAGGASLLIGNAYQAQMPEFAHDLNHGDAGFSYSMLLLANAAGALAAGIGLESRSLLRASPRTAHLLAMLWCCALGAFALTSGYEFALVLLFVAGFLELAFNAMAQTLVQINAPAATRGRVIGVFSMASLGMRTFSGLTIGVVGGLIGVHWSLALSAMLMFVATSALYLYSIRSAPAHVARE